MPFHPILEDPVLRLPILGKTYVVQSPNAATGLWVQSMMSAAQLTRAGFEVDSADARLVLEDDDERNLYERVLGDTYDELVADAVKWPHIQRAGKAALLWIHRGEEAAELFWNGGSADPKAPDPEADESTASEAPPA
jgi:hypothetical protein